MNGARAKAGGNGRHATTIADLPAAGAPSMQSIGAIGDVVIEVTMGDITALAFDAIVCPANSFLEMRGGVSALIRDRAGPSEGGNKDQLERDAVALGPIRPGDAVLTLGYDLPSRFVIHAPTVEMPVDRSSRRTVALAMGAALRVAFRHSFKTLGVPSLGTGTGGVGYPEAAEEMLRELVRVVSLRPQSSLRRVTFVAWEEPFMAALLRVPFPPPPTTTVSPEPGVSSPREASWVE